MNFVPDIVEERATYIIVQCNDCDGSVLMDSIRSKVVQYRENRSSKQTTEKELDIQSAVIWQLYNNYLSRTTNTPNKKKIQEIYIG